ncbi:MAG: hypothetical protein ACLPV8_12770 [Steroidobacteraceae bacterium]
MGNTKSTESRSAASRLFIVAASLTATLAACASSDSFVLVGAARPAISPAEVKIYSHPPLKFEEIALLNASTNHMFTPGGQKTIDEVIEKLKEQAAKLGANGVILEGFSDRQTGSLGTGVGGGSASGNSAVGVGVGGSFGIYKKNGQGRAIFVPPE